MIHCYLYDLYHSAYLCMYIDIRSGSWYLCHRATRWLRPSMTLAAMHQIRTGDINIHESTLLDYSTTGSLLSFYEEVVVGRVEVPVETITEG